MSGRVQSSGNITPKLSSDVARSGRVSHVELGVVKSVGLDYKEKIKMTVP